MARLPIPGSDKGNWGQILNDYLSAAHKADGTLKANSVNTASIIDGAVTEAKLAAAVRTKLNTVGGGGGAQGATGPQGPQGPAGTNGTNGTNGSQGATGPAGPQGPAGTPGSAGAAGPAGPQGATGPAGPQGAAGTGVTILGSYATQGELPPSGNPGDGYLVSGNLFVWNGTAWEDVGTIQGPAGATGAQGSAGAPGAQGATGPAGPQGPAGSGSNWNIRAVTTSSVTAADGDWIVANPASNAITVQLPAPAANARVRVKRNAVSGNSILITTASGMLDGGEPTMATLNAGWSSADYESDGTNWFTV